MKAYTVRDKESYEGTMTVVFAESSGKAKALARSTRSCEDAEFINIRCNRSPEFDKCYSEGKIEMEWENVDDRIALVKAGWMCADEHDCDYENCSAAEYCVRRLEEMEYER